MQTSSFHRLATLANHLAQSNTATSPSKKCSQKRETVDNGGILNHPPREVCLIVGVGRGASLGVAKKFAREGATVCLARRSPLDTLQPLVDEIVEDVHLSSVNGGGNYKHASGHDGKLELTSGGGREKVNVVPYGGVDATKEEDVRNLVARVESEVGPITCCVYNIGAQVGHRPFHKISTRLFEQCWRMGCLGAFLVGREVSERMVKREDGGTIIFTSATAACRGNAGQAAHSMAMFGRRALAQSMFHELSPKGIHIAHVVVDSVIESPDTLGKFFSRFSRDSEKSYEDFVKQRKSTNSIVLPAEIGSTYWFLHKQPRCAWTFEMDLRTWTDKAWFHD